MCSLEVKAKSNNCCQIKNFMDTKEKSLNHLTDGKRLEVIKAYIYHEILPLISQSSKTSMVSKLDGIDQLAEQCKNAKDNIEEMCKEIYDLFYGLSLIYKRKFIGREITGKNCEWEDKVTVPSEKLILTTDIDSYTKNAKCNGCGNINWTKCGEMKQKYNKCFIETIVNDIKSNDGLIQTLSKKGDEYCKKRGKYVKDPIIVLKCLDCKDYYIILDGNGRALYTLYKNSFNPSVAIPAYVGVCEGIPKNFYEPWGIYHFIEQIKAGNYTDIINEIMKILNNTEQKAKP